jgi:diamine N-acetyltransferase
MDVSTLYITPTIRSAVPADYAALVPIDEEVHALHAAAFPSIFRPVGEGSSLPRSFFDDLLAGDESTILVAEVEGAVAGFAIVEVFDAPPFEVLVPRRSVHIGSMAVAASRRRQGIGRALVEAAIEYGRTHGAGSLELTVWEWNTEAQAFYQRLGLAPLHRALHREL